MKQPNPTLVVSRMSQISVGGEHRPVAMLWMWCPACEAPHKVSVHEGEDVGRGWTWNGSEESPTITPSIRVQWDGVEGEQEVTKVCHSFLTDGVWRYLEDCTHSKAGQEVPMEPVPDWLLA